MGMRMCDLVVCGLEVWGRPGSVDGNIARLLAGVIPLFATLVIGGRAGLAVHSSRNVLGAGKVNKAAHNHGIDAPKVGSFKPSTLTLPLVVQSSTDINRASSPTWVTFSPKTTSPNYFSSLSPLPPQPPIPKFPAPMESRAREALYSPALLTPM